MSKRWKVICSIYLLWCIIIGTKETIGMIKDLIIRTCTYIINHI